MSTLVVGLGSANGDDRVGWLVADRLLQDAAGNARRAARLEWVRHASVRRAGSPLDVLDWLEGVRRLVLCDASEPLGRPGRRCRWTWPAPELRGLRCRGSHDFSVPAVLELAEALGALPQRVVVFGIEAGGCSAPGRLTPAVAAAVAAAAGAVREECLTP